MSSVSRRIVLSAIALCCALLLAPEALNAQLKPTTTASSTTLTSDYGTLLSLKLKTSKLKVVHLAQDPPMSVTGTGSCPGIGPATFSYDFSTQSVPAGDTSDFYDGTHSSPVLEITHLRVNTTASANGNTVTQRQDWTRIKENDNGLDNVTGIRHYIGNFLEETQTPSGGNPVITAESQGVMTLREPLFISTGSLAGFANRVQVVQFIGSQASWLEPFEVNDARTCDFLSTGVPQTVDPLYNDHCVVNSSNAITYNGVSFKGNIVGCAQTTWP